MSAGHAIEQEARPDDLVSVVIPCFNHARYLAEAIESVRSQTHHAVEIIVVDDASTDATYEVAAGFGDVRYARHARNRGLASSRNTGLGLARGEYVVFLDADDTLLPEGIAAGVHCLRSNPQAAFAFGFFRAISKDGAKAALGERTRPLALQDLYAQLLVHNVIEMIATVIFRRRVVVDAGGFDPALRACEDYDLLLRLSRRNAAAEHQQLVACYRMHPENMSHRYALMLRTSLQALRKQRKNVQGHPDVGGKIRRRPPVLEALVRQASVQRGSGAAQ